MFRLIIILPTILLSSVLSARTIVVGKDQPITSIRKAIELAKEKDTILVQAGIYKEGNIVVNKNIILLGQNYPVLDGEKKFEIFTVSGVNITIKGFQLQNCGQSAMNDYASIKVIDAKNILIEDNRVINSFFGIHFGNSSYITIRHNSISGSPTSEQNTGNGIHLWKCNHALIDNNYITGHRDGIYFEFVTESTIQNNLSEKNIRYGLHFMFSNDDNYFNNTFNNNGAGVAVMYSHKVKMEGNNFQMNWGPSSYGILLKDISDSYIQHNTFYKNSVGIHMEGSSRINAFKNIFKENGWAIKVQASCDDNNFYQNNFYGNSFDIATNGTMMLNKFYNNYWDKYEGYDRNKDGVGDVPYHPVSMYSMIVEQNPNSLILLRSFMVSLLDKAEKAIPSLTPENLTDDKPMIKPNKL
ncbi:MAG TPA: nitrous oxide reductase family maturation protein NosD [Chitinophagaceae bacterium]|jgi:nitrous oxidase accessory protein|nr:nitrous oxide reductase family maturation protein NosD [Chitinophagaceae bacterium]